MYYGINKDINTFVVRDHAILLFYIL